jgi:hypothetical protein
MAEQLKLQTAQQMHIWKMEEIALTKGYDYQTKKLVVAQADAAVDKKIEADIIQTGMTTEAAPVQEEAMP